MGAMLTTSMDDSTERTLETTETSLDVLETLRELEGASLNTLQDRIEIPKSTLYYHVNTLENRGYIVKENNEYKLGFTFLVYGQYVKAREDENVMAKEATQKLGSQLGEDVDFSIEENGQLIVLHHVLGESAKHGNSFELGEPLNLPSSSAGRAILAEYPRSRVDEIVSQWGFEGTKDGPTDRKSLYNRLDMVQERGYAINDEEWISGLCAISGAVNYPDGSVLGALSIIIPSFRFDPDNLNGLSTPLMNTIDELEARLVESQSGDNIH
jgi:IclR family acetate operon transcriptional repressor